jgi:hypothetical protein
MKYSGRQATREGAVGKGHHCFFTKRRLGTRQVVMGDTEYSVFDTSDTTNSGIGIDY